MTKPKATKPAQGKDGRFLTGNIGGGRPAGSRNKLSEVFLDALCDDFDRHGAGVIERVRQAEPAAYLRVVANLMPKRVEADPKSLNDLSDAELADIIQRDNPDETAPSEIVLGKAKH